MTDRDALMATILAHPDDDLARLVFADWLEEYGDEEDAAHANLIRIQCELAKTKKPSGCCDRKGNTVSSSTPMKIVPCDCQWSGLRRLSDDIAFGVGTRLVQHVCRGFTHCSIPYKECPTLTTRPTPNLVFLDRGFIYAVICDGPTWLDHGVDLAKQQPIEFVTLTTELPLMIDGPHWSDHRNAAERRWELRSSWNVRRTDTTNRYGTGWESERLAMQSVISDHDILSGKRGEEFLARSVEYFRQECRANATVEGYLRLKWPKVKFTRMGGEPPGPGRQVNDVVTHNNYYWLWAGDRWDNRGRNEGRFRTAYGREILTWDEYQRRGRGEIIAGTYQRYMSEPMGMTTRPPTASWDESGESPLDAIRRARDLIMRDAPRPPEPPFFHDPV